MKQYHISDDVFVRTDWPENDKAPSPHHKIELWLSVEAALELYDELDMHDLAQPTKEIGKALKFALDPTA